MEGAAKAEDSQTTSVEACVSGEAQSNSPRLWVLLRLFHVKINAESQEEVFLRVAGVEPLHLIHRSLSALCSRGHSDKILKVSLQAANDLLIPAVPMSRVKRPASTRPSPHNLIQGKNPILYFSHPNPRAAPSMNAIVKKVESQKSALFRNY